MRAYLKYRYRNAEPSSHLWLGVSIENSSCKVRIEHLRQSPAAVRFLSIEPLIGPVGPINLNGIHWVIAGGESGSPKCPCCARSGTGCFIR
jgi:protein gp37